MATVDSSNTFKLIGRRHLLNNNSWMHNYKRLTKGPDRCFMMMHPDDMKKVGLKEGGEARVKSRVGEVLIKVSPSEKLMPGVVSIPHGFGHNREGIKLEIASKSPGISVNDLTDDQIVDSLTGNSVLNGVPVMIYSD